MQGSYARFFFKIFFKSRQKSDMDPDLVTFPLVRMLTIGGATVYAKPMLKVCAITANGSGPSFRCLLL